MASLIPLSILFQDNRWKIKQWKRNENVLYFSYFPHPPNWSSLIESCFANFTTDPRNDKEEIKEIMESNETLQRQGERIDIPLCPQLIFLPQGFIPSSKCPIILYFFLDGKMQTQILSKL